MTIIVRKDKKIRIHRNALFLFVSSNVKKICDFFFLTPTSNKFCSQRILSWQSASVCILSIYRFINTICMVVLLIANIIYTSSCFFLLILYNFCTDNQEQFFFLSLVIFFSCLNDDDDSDIIVHNKKKIDDVWTLALFFLIMSCNVINIQNNCSSLFL